MYPKYWYIIKERSNVSFVVLAKKSSEVESQSEPTLSLCLSLSLWKRRVIVLKKSIQAANEMPEQSNDYRIIVFGAGSVGAYRLIDASNMRWVLD